MELNITESQLLEALLHAASPDNPEGAMTMQDLRQELGWGYQKIRAELHRLNREGKLEVTRVILPDLTGRMAPRPAYRVLKGGTREGDSREGDSRIAPTTRAGG